MAKLSANGYEVARFERVIPSKTEEGSITRIIRSVRSNGWILQRIASEWEAPYGTQKHAGHWSRWRRCNEDETGNRFPAIHEVCDIWSKSKNWTETFNGRA